MKPFLVFNFFFNSFMVVVVFLFPGWAGFVIGDFSFVFVSPLPVEGVESLFVFAQPTPFILHSSIHQANHPRSTLLLGEGGKKTPPYRRKTNTAQQQLTAQTQISTTAQSARAGETIASADAEIARFHEILRQIDELEVEFDKVRHIRDIVKGFRSRVEGLERKIDGRGGGKR